MNDYCRDCGRWVALSTTTGICRRCAHEEKDDDIMYWTTRTKYFRGRE